MANYVQPATHAAPPRATAAAVSSKMLDRIRANPKGDWEISDIETACRQLGLTCTSPTRGSHHKISSPHVEGILMMPHKRPIKVPYIKLFIGLAEAHIEFCPKVEKANG